MGIFRDLTAAEKWKVLSDARVILQGRRLSEAPGGQLRGAIVRALQDGGWYKSGYGSDRERSVTREVGRANSKLRASTAQEIEDWAKNRSADEVMAVLSNAIDSQKP